MVNQMKTLERLRKERDYEERIAKNISDYFLFSLDNIKELNEKEKDQIKKGLNIIREESLIHERLINELIQMVVENGENQY
jgi:hypothetical protein